MVFDTFLNTFPAGSVLAASLGALLGVVIGSFLNVVIHRLPIMIEHDWEGKPASLSLSQPASFCPSCRRPIRWFENVPLVSYLMLKGRCSACNTEIGFRYFLVELVTGCLFALIFLQHGFSAQGLAWSVYTAFLICLALIDWDTTFLPDTLNQPLLWIGLVASAFGVTGISLENSLAGAVIGFLFFWSLSLAFRRLAGKEGLGRGDFKLLAAMGAWLGWQALPIVLIIAGSSALIAGLIMRKRGTLREGLYIPFGPFLALAGILLMLVAPARFYLVPSLSF
jgi:leader peptidase (prepilin peptidase) / N-methyltransferase